jgi:hypothetical protein
LKVAGLLVKNTKGRRFPEDYKYSSARFYEKNEKDWVFLMHHEG